jgi:hypothetical protein
MSLAALDAATPKEPNDMQSQNAAAIHHAAIPPLDARTPRELAVAVFGMG